jgi:hypothetical protein
MDGEGMGEDCLLRLAVGLLGLLERWLGISCGVGGFVVFMYFIGGDNGEGKGALGSGAGTIGAVCFCNSRAIMT